MQASEKKGTILSRCSSFKPTSPKVDEKKRLVTECERLNDSHEFVIVEGAQSAVPAGRRSVRANRRQADVGKIVRRRHSEGQF